MLQNFGLLLLWLEEHGVSGWAQALGAVAAIWFSARVGRQDRGQASVHRIEALHGIALTAVPAMQDGLRAVRAAQPASAGQPANMDSVREFDLADLSDVDALLQGVSVLDLASTKAPGTIVRLRKCIRCMRQEIEALAAGSRLPSALTVQRLEDLTREVEAIEVRVQGWLDGRVAAAKRWWLP